MIPQVLIDELVTLVSHKEGKLIEAGKVRPLAGGSINEACMIQLDGVRYFVKWNSRSRYPGMFEAEANGLNLLSSTRTLRIPQQIATGNCGPYSYLLLEFIETGRPTSGSWERFGVGLAELHRNTFEFFGLDSDNYIGSLLQVNRPRYASWPQFFVECRLRPQLKLAVQKGLINSSMQNQFDRLFSKMDKLFPAEPPSLLHGDLWSGNFLFADNGEACLIDPAVYFGHREMDIAMSLLFGGFDQSFYQSYHESWPLEKGWHERVDLCNLYPLLVHVNLFGGSYVSQTRAILNRFT
jgi:fructosamine-3-kinase